MTASVPTNDGLVRRLMAGYGIQGFNIVAMLCLQIFIVPVFLLGWGKEAYGDWLVLSAAAGFLALADLGTGGVFANRLRSTWSRGEREPFGRVVQVGLTVYAGLVVMWALVLVVVVKTVNLPALFGLAHWADASAIFLLLSFANLLTVPRGLFTAIYSARGEFGREGSLNLVFFGGPILVQGSCVALGAGPLQVAVASFLASLLLGWGPLLADLRRHHREVLLTARLPTRSELAELAGKAPLYLVPASAGVLLLQVPVVLLGLLAPPAAVVFTTMRTFTGLTRQVTMQFFIVTSVEMARQHAQRDEDGLLRLYANSGRLIGGIAGLLAGLSLILGPAFFSLWTGGAIAFDPVLACVFLATILALGPTFGSTWLLRHTDHPQAAAIGFGVQAVLGIVLCLLLLAAGLGPVGAALGLGVAELVAPGLQSMAVVSRVVGTRVHALALPIYGATLAAFGLGTGAALGAERLAPGGGIVGIVATAGLWLVLVAVPASVLLFDARQRAGLHRRLTRLAATLRWNEPA